MKSILFILLMLTLSCGKKSDEPGVTQKPVTPNQKSSNPPGDYKVSTGALIGSWVNSENEMGFELNAGGKAASINMTTLEYNSWKIDGNKLIINSTSRGVANPVTVDEVYIIRTVTPDRMVLSPSNNPDTNWTYNKQK